MSIRRIEEANIKKYFANIPVIAIIGARQVGKTTVAKLLLAGYKNTLLLNLN